MTYEFQFPRSAQPDAAIMGGVDQPGYGQRCKLETKRSAEIQSRSVEAVIRAEMTKAKVLADTLAAQQRTVAMWQNQHDRLMRRAASPQSETICPILQAQLRNITARLDRAKLLLERAEQNIAQAGPDIAARISHWRASHPQTGNLEANQPED